jgi:hypothetical protein
MWDQLTEQRLLKETQPDRLDVGEGVDELEVDSPELIER